MRDGEVLPLAKCAELCLLQRERPCGRIGRKEHKKRNDERACRWTRGFSDLWLVRRQREYDGGGKGM